MVSNVLTSVAGGYKGTVKDFENLITVLGKMFETNKKIDLAVTDGKLNIAG